MNSQLCRLCLQNNQDVINIWQTIQDSTVATILAKHFWFLQIDKTDGLTEWLCQVCWVRTKVFHEFYQNVEEFQKSYWDSATVVAEGKNTEPSSNFTKEITESRLKTICSNTGNQTTVEKTELELEVVDLEINQGDDDNNCDETSSNLNVKSKPIDAVPPIADIQKIQIRLKGDSGDSFSQSDELINKTIREEQNRELNGQIREFYTMKCDLCSVGDFDTLLDVKRHYRREHQTTGYLKCCDKQFYLRCELLDHMRFHIMTPETAEVDAKIYEWFTMKCDICNDVTFTTLLDMRRHYRIVHKVRGYLTCCNKKYNRRHGMVAHMRSHINPDAYHCEQCDRSFSTKQSLKNHIAHHVPLDSRAFKCNLCSSSFSREAILKVHIRNKHTSKNGQKFPCDKCNKNYPSELLLKCHVRQSHENSLSYVCEACARQFKTKHTLRYHVISEHSAKPQPKVQCDICGNWLKNECNLSRHVKEQHHDAEPAKCHICNKVVASKFRLRKHINYVHGKKNYHCTLCDKTFCRATGLKEHVATHTGEDLYKCQYCDKKFKSGGNCSSHMKKTHFAEWTSNIEKKMGGNRKIATQVEN